MQPVPMSSVDWFPTSKHSYSLRRFAMKSCFPLSVLRCPELDHSAYDFQAFWICSIGTYVAPSLWAVLVISCSGSSSGGPM